MRSGVSLFIFILFSMIAILANSACGYIKVLEGRNDEKITWTDTSGYMTEAEVVTSFDSCLEKFNVAVLGFGEGDSESSVTQSFRLPLKFGDCDLVWSVNSEAFEWILISEETAVVIRPQGDNDGLVILTAQLSLGSKSDSRSFTLIVKKDSSASDTGTDKDSGTSCKDSLTSSRFIFADGDSISKVTQNFTVPVKQDNCVGSWSSGSSWISSISNSTGLVTLSRQVATSDESVVLSATVRSSDDSGASESKTIIVTIARYLTDAEVDSCAAAVGVGSLTFTAPDTASSVTQGFTLPTTITSGSALCTLTWAESPDTAVVSVSGSSLSVNRPSYASGNASVVLRATASGGSAYTKQSSDVGFTVSRLSATDLERANECQTGFSASNVTYSSPDTATSVTKNFTLPETLVISGNSCVFSAWQSNNAAIVLSGTEQRSAAVTRAADDEANTTVLLAGTVSYNGTPASSSAAATVSVQKYSEAESVAACKAALTSSDFTGINTPTNPTAATVPVASSSITFPTTKSGVGGKTCTLSWASNNTSYISISGGTGAVTHEYDAADTYVTLTPTISRGSTSDATKTFSIRVISLFTAPSVSTTYVSQNKDVSTSLSINFSSSNVVDSSTIVYKICYSQNSADVGSISAMDSGAATCQTTTTAYPDLSAPLVIDVNAQVEETWYANVYSMVQGQPDVTTKKILYTARWVTIQ